MLGKHGALREFDVDGYAKNWTDDGGYTTTCHIAGGAWTGYRAFESGSVMVRACNKLDGESFVYLTKDEVAELAYAAGVTK